MGAYSIVAVNYKGEFLGWGLFGCQDLFEDLRYTPIGLVIYRKFSI